MSGNVTGFKYTMTRSGNYQRVIVYLEGICHYNDDPGYTPKEVSDLISVGWAQKNVVRLSESGSGARASKPKDRRQPKKDKSSSNLYSQKGMKSMKDEGSHLLYKEFKIPMAMLPVVNEFSQLMLSFMEGCGIKTYEKGKYSIDIPGFVRAYETGENPVEYLSKPVDRVRRPRVLVTPDNSGSCTSFSEFTMAFAKKLSEEIDVEMIDNVNGDFGEDISEEFDFVIYFGDSDVLYRSIKNKGQDQKLENCVIGQKCPIIAFSNDHCNKLAQPRYKGRVLPNVYYVDGVKLTNMSDYAIALKTVIAKKYLK